MAIEFRPLRADEIDVRVSLVSQKGCALILYKDARCDQIILDETVGAMNWQRHHSRDNANCTVSIWDAEKAQWIEKEDTGTESNTEKEKGLASDSFKRACFNWGIGRELYTAPFIWIPVEGCNIEQINGKWTTKDRFKVTALEIEGKKIVGLQIMNTKRGVNVFSFGTCNGNTSYNAPSKPTDAPEVILCKKCKALIKGGKNAQGVFRTPAEIAQQTGGLCVQCFKAGASM